ncbi:RNA polymerase sigma-70 factor, ECF subfamily [Steroidobacter denitrificans]|uniref:RNA polymerase sigma-70 factor, ECF subfamily n=1 Tax=Steroidobacter denitrificans TaxID=465721 RepID=A0A127FE61_STEDE|nr:RNA polymerase sigma factor [Steroidobacter denitrificans]AMN48038.1 RNA polymerase sigma-70 factor, ECF subfamily [Steroidobacter denitrificans]
MKKITEADAELIALMLKGDEIAFRRFFETYFPRLYRFAAPRLGGDSDAAKEVVQATLIKAMRNLENYRGEAAVFSWLCQICRRQIIDHVRTHRRHLSRLALVEDSDEMQRVLEAIAAPCDDEPLHGYSADETRRIVQSVLDKLPNRYGDVLEWKYIEGRSVEEIAALLGVGQIAVQSMLARARVAFRSVLETVFGMAANDVLSGMRGH